MRRALLKSSMPIWQNSLGNLVNRTLGMAKKYCQGRIPKCNAEDIPSDNPLKLLGKNLGQQVNIYYNDLAFQDACETILTLVRSSNKYIDDLAPWTLFKQEKTRRISPSFILCFRISSLVSLSIITDRPKKLVRIFTVNWGWKLISISFCGNHISTQNTQELELPADWERHLEWGILQADCLLGEAHPIFAKLEPNIVSSS